MKEVQRPHAGYRDQGRLGTSVEDPTLLYWKTHSRTHKGSGSLECREHISAKLTALRLGTWLCAG